jgi:hypothetical protein
MFGFLDLDLRTSILSLKTCSSATGSLVSQVSTGGLLHLPRRLEVGACSLHAKALIKPSNAWSSHLPSPPPSASALGDSRKIRFSLLLRSHSWAECGSHAPLGTAPTQPIHVLLLLLLLFFFFSCISRFFLLYTSPHVHPCNCVWVIVTQYTCQITFNGDPGFVASVP